MSAWTNAGRSHRAELAGRSGDLVLIEALLSDPGLEAVRLPRAD